MIIDGFDVGATIGFHPLLGIPSLLLMVDSSTFLNQTLLVQASGLVYL